jgi:hypothetical protein
MKCIAAAVAGFITLIPPASAQDSRLKAALTACMTRAATNPLPQMLDVEGDVVARRAGNIACSSHRSHGLNICTMTIEATAPFAKQAR